jgi:hypothetical protein
MSTTDDFDRVRLHYAKLTMLWKVNFNLPGVAWFRTKSGNWIDGVAQMGLNEEIVKQLGIDPVPWKATFGARRVKDETAEKGQKPQPVSVVTFFRDTAAYNVHVVISRAPGAKHTHVIVTYLRK